MLWLILWLTCILVMLCTNGRAWGMLTSGNTANVEPVTSPVDPDGQGFVKASLTCLTVSPLVVDLWPG